MPTWDEATARARLDALATIRRTLEHLAAPDMWEQVEGSATGPDADLMDPLVWRGGDHPADLTREGLAALAEVEAVFQALKVPDQWQDRDGRGMPVEFMRLWRTFVELADSEDGRALVRMVFWQDEERKKLEAENAALKARLEALEPVATGLRNRTLP